MAEVREWIEYEMYGELWQPGFVAWKDGKIEPFHDWPLMDAETLRWTQSYIDNVGDFSSVTDWRAVYVKQHAERGEFVAGSAHDRVDTWRKVIKEWNDQDKADDAWNDCNLPDFDFEDEDVDA